MKLLRKYILLFGTFISYGLGFYTIYLFLKAYSTPQKALVFKINHFGEANIELVLMGICAVAMLYSLAYMIRHFRRKES